MQTTRKLNNALMAYLDAQKWEEAFGCLKLLWGERDYRAVEIFRDAIKKGKITKKSLEFYRMSYDLTAPDVFDDFMLALEWNRAAGEQFWLPRREKLMPACNALQDLEDGRLDELFLSMPPRVGKALADDTPILTKQGWKTHGELVVGDEVIGLNGEFKKVVAVHPKCMLDRVVEFTNGERIQCHENHEWLFYDRRSGKTALKETKAWERSKLDTGKPGVRGHRYVLQLPRISAVQGEPHPLALDAYALGAWLGDGANLNPTICNARKDRAIIDKIIENGVEHRWKTVHSETGVEYHGFNMRKGLQEYGMCHSRKRTEKHIPDAYMTAPEKIRLALLAGLLDTDGTLARKERRYHFTTCEEQLKDDMVTLVSTFGWRASVMEYAPRISSGGVKGNRITYRVSFNPDRYIPCQLERKQLHEFSKQRRVAVKSITKVAPKQGNCITVEGDGMYLAGRQLIPTHNTTLIVFFILWIILRDSERSNLYSSYSDGVVKVFYNGLLEILNDPYTYRWKEIFPERTIASTDAKDLLLNIDRKKRYASFTARSLYGTLNGACDCNGYEIADDLHSGIEEAMSRDRLNAAWFKVDNNFLPRAKEGAKNLWIGTRWSLYDAIARRIDLLENDEKFKKRRYQIINLPALDENDESNFEYLYGVGFSSDYYQQRRASFERGDDIASWLAQYQCEPIERSGTVFSVEDFRYYNGVLPEADPDRVFVAVDPAWGGGDYVAAVLIHQYEAELFISDVVYSNEDKRTTQPLVAKLAIDGNASAMYIEGTKTTSSYAEGVQEILRSRDYRLNLQTTVKHWSGVGKSQRIFDRSPDIKENMVFLSPEKRKPEYTRFMENVFAFKIEGKNKHDDAPDVLAMAAAIVFSGEAKAIIQKRIF